MTEAEHRAEIDRLWKHIDVLTNALEKATGVQLPKPAPRRK